MIGKKVLTKIVLLLIVLFGVTILTFVYTNLSPVDAAEAWLCVVTVGQPRSRLN